MIDLLLDFNSTGDLNITNFDLALTSSNEEYLSQKLWIRFKTFLGELFVDTSLGIPYFESVFIKNPDFVLITSIFKAVILSEPLVAELLKFDLVSLDGATRNLRVDWTVQLVDDSVVSGTSGGSI